VSQLNAYSCPANGTLWQKFTHDIFKVGVQRFQILTYNANSVNGM